jgi:5'-3' exonuclease
VTYLQLLDTSSLMYRAFFALPRTMVDREGRAINAVHGYLDMTARLVREYVMPADPQARLVHVYDHDWRPAGRVAAYPGYKANRAADPEELPAQFDLLREVLNALGEAQAEAPGWEADDAIGALTARAPVGTHIDIVTGDRDLIQLVRDIPSGEPLMASATVNVLFTTKGVSELKRFDSAAVREIYGVPPDRYADFAMLRGDPSDGLPGIKGVGEKTAQRLIQQYPTLDALLDDSAAQPQRLATALREARDYIAAMRDVVPVRTHVEVREWAEPYDEARLEVFATARKLGGPLRRLRDAYAQGSD